MAKFTHEVLRERAFYRVAWVLSHFWEEQKDEIAPGGKASVHSRLFDTLVHEPLIVIGKSINGGGRKEHLVPCVFIRDLAFKMYSDNKSIDDVSKMISRLLRIAHITPEEAKILDVEKKLKTTMPVNWDIDTGSIMARLDAGEIKLNLLVDPKSMNDDEKNKG